MDTYVGDESLEEHRYGTHVLHDQPKIIVWCAEEVRADHDGEVVGCHVVLLFIVHDAVKELRSLRICLLYLGS